MMRDLVESLCSDACAGRATGTAGGELARRIVRDALREAGCDPDEQLVPQCSGANVLATIPGVIDRWVLIAAHYDHLGQHGGAIYRGADDNAAAVAILVDVARALAAHRPEGRGVIIAAFDAEEPPFFGTEAMGSEYFARHPTVPLDRIDLMVCMDLVGHALGPEGLPSDVRDTMFALGAERSPGVDAVVDEHAQSESGLVVRRVDAAIIPPMSDYGAFWSRERPFVFLTNARSRVYHTPMDVPALLAWEKIAATARWLGRFVRVLSVRDAPFFFSEKPDDISTLDTVIALTDTLGDLSAEARVGNRVARELRSRCDREGILPSPERAQLEMLVSALESGLA